ncbi:DUF2231 domain-containing protein [Streptomyces sp. NPDC001941]|uniref:DUF2231 domain-containing protein n=1 Tax=Streptomyces sp. NPDC001941 TaxID=3154659 RepID=UPI003321359C
MRFTPVTATQDSVTRGSSVPGASERDAAAPGFRFPAPLARLTESLDAVASNKALDVLTRPLRLGVRALPLGKAREVLRGVPLGHALHPAAVQVPVGAWLSAAALDLVPGNERAARFLVGLGVVSALPAAASGWVDWSEQRHEQLRTGLVHAAANSVGLVCYARSWRRRGQDRMVAGKVWGFAGLAAVGVGGFIGGHIAYRQGVEPVETLPPLPRTPEG